MTEEHAKNIYMAFQTQGHTGVCNTCHCVRTCFSNIVDLTTECFGCCIKRLVKEEEQKEHEAKCNLFMKDFAKI